MRAALLAAVHRNETLLGSQSATRTRSRPSSCPRSRCADADRAAASGMGASLGALAMLHAHRMHPELFGGLFLQSGSFFRRELDGYERGFPRFERIARFVGRCSPRARRGRDPIPVAMTCGLGEENLANNRAMRDALARRATRSSWSSTATRTTGSSWRDALEPHLHGCSWSACGSETRDIAARGRRADRLRALRPAGARVPLRAGPPPGSTRSAA